MKSQLRRVTGTYKHPWHTGEIDGTVKDRYLRFTWKQNNTGPGTGRFKLSDDSKSFIGYYSDSKNPDDEAAGRSWTGKRK